MKRRNLIKTAWASLFGGATVASAKPAIDADITISVKTADALISVSRGLTGISHRLRFEGFDMREAFQIDPKDESIFKDRVEKICKHLKIKNEWLGWIDVESYFGSKKPKGLGHRVIMEADDSWDQIADLDCLGCARVLDESELKPLYEKILESFDNQS